MLPPPTSDLAEGEIAVNYNANNPFLAIKDSNGQIRKISPAISKTESFNATGFCKFLEIPIADYMYSLGLYSITTARGLAGIVSLYVYSNRGSAPEVTLSYFGTVRLKDILRIKKNSSTISIFARDDYTVSFSFLDLGGQVGRYDTNLLTDLKIYTASELSQFGDDYGNIYYNVADNVAHSLTVAGKTFNGSSDVNVDSIDCGEF